MKKLILMLLFSTVAIAQNNDRNFEVVFSLGIDPKMATLGAHPGEEGNKPSLDYEVSFGFEWENSRLLTQYKNHKAVNFSKWTYIQYDLKRSPFKNIYVYGGLEASLIRKKHPDASYDQPDNYRDVTINPMIFGANLEVQWKFNNDKFGIGSQFSIYQSEDELREYKQFRKEFTIAFFVYL
jgi:hypothetical protein